ncbi:hypothetical protein OF829_10110 [Sphingomonas sp. LB-2]|uniref:hypothetical protein n=1 Tax=Sphingomonas caeni TaxID=2984949 RepID=UPI00223142E2|nr:hypothetical protein [Sphingomonas caeni]MCW3847597.1 hypothetical protein [Sphingomonas caeni]
MFDTSEKYYTDPGSGRPSLRPGTGTKLFAIWTMRLGCLVIIVTGIAWVLAGKTSSMLALPVAAIVLIQAEFLAWRLRREKAALTEALRIYERGLSTWPD